MISNVAELLQGLNPEQREAVLHHRGSLLVASGAGSGKTTVITKRIAHLVLGYKVDPRRILAVTFSKKAADEMNVRLQQLLGRTPARVGTFHSLAYEIVRADVPFCAHWEVDDKDHYRQILKEVCGHKHMNWADSDLTFLDEVIGLAKGSLLTPESDGLQLFLTRIYKKEGRAYANPQKVFQAYELAEQFRKERQLLTFNDMLVEAVRAFDNTEALRARWAERYDYLLVDEAQDTDHAQEVLAKHFAVDHEQYMMVGDPAQNIYAFRGARPEKLLSFEKDWGAKVIHMGRNYRSGSVIIEAANLALNAMDPNTRLPMELIAERPLAGEITSTVYQDLDEEGTEVANKLLQFHEDGIPWEKMAVIYRVNAQSRAFEEACIAKRIPYQVAGSVNFYERREIKDVLSYLRAITYGRTDEVLRSMNSPFRFLAKRVQDYVKEKHSKLNNGSVPNWMAFAKEVVSEQGLSGNGANSVKEWARVMQKVREMMDPVRADRERPASILEWILTETKFYDWLIREEGRESTENNRISNLRELVRSADRFGNVPELLEYIDLTIRNSKRNAQNPRPNSVMLLTIHRSKGLEYDVVFLVGVNENVLPHKKTEDLGEERRLFYVGVTRARDHLWLSCVEGAGEGDERAQLAPSRFLEEIRRVPVPFDRTNAPAKTLKFHILPDPINIDIPF